MRPGRLIYLALGGAAIALLAGVSLFFAPFGASQSLANRGTAAAALVSGFAVVLSALALVATVRVGSSDFRAEERVNEDMTRLLSSLRSIYLKAAWLTDQPKKKDKAHASLFDDERRVVQEFLTSTTAPAFYALEGRISARAGKQGEEWRLFSYYLIDILRAPMPENYRIIANRAVRTERLITELLPDELDRLSKDASSLSRAIREFARNRAGSTLATAAYKAFGGESDLDKARAVSMGMLQALKRKGVADPDIDLLIASIQRDKEGIRRALNAGAQIGITVGDLMSRYKDQLGATSPLEKVASPPDAK